MLLLSSVLNLSMYLIANHYVHDKELHIHKVPKQIVNI